MSCGVCVCVCGVTSSSICPFMTEWVGKGVLCQFFNFHFILSDRTRHFVLLVLQLYFMFCIFVPKLKLRMIKVMRI